MENNSSLNPLGIEFGKVSAPAVNSKSMSAFEGDDLKDNKIDYFPVTPPLNSTNPNYVIQDGITGHAPGRPASQNPNKKISPTDLKEAIGKSFQMRIATNHDKNQYAQVNAYNAGPSGNSFYKRYAAYGQEKFDAIGFSPLRDNEAMFNAHTTMGDDFTRMMKNSFMPLLGRGFVAGPKSLIKMMQGDFSADLEDARAYENAAAIGQSSKKGMGAFFNNTAMSFAYTAGIISEAILEEAAGALLAPVTGGGSFFAATANNARKIGKIGDAIDLATDGYRAINNTLKEANSIGGARKMWNAAENIGKSKVGQFLNPLENTYDAIVGIGKNSDNLTGLARLAQGTNKTAGGLFRDIKNINMALSEARLEGGMNDNKVYDDLYNEFYKKNGRAPNNDEQYTLTKTAKDAGMNTLKWNTALILASNKIVIPNLLKSGISNKALKSRIDDVYSFKGGKIVLEKTTEVGKKLAKGEFKFVEDSLKNSLKGFKAAPMQTVAKVSGRYLKANLMEGVQENLQDVISVANEKYYETAYKNKELGAHLYNRGLSSLMYEGLKGQFSSQGLETFASGALMGLFSGGLNLAKGGLDYGYNNTFNKEKYQEYKDLRAKHGKDVSDQLTALYKNPEEFFSSRVFNYGVQNNIISNIDNADTKEAKDELSEAFASQIHTALDTNTLNYFKDHIASFKELSPEEFEEAFGFEQGTGAKEQQKIDTILGNIDSVEKSYNYAKERFPNPVDLSKYDENTPEFESAALLNKAWKVGVRDYVYANHAFRDTSERMLKISGSVLNNPTMKNMSQQDMNFILNPSTIDVELNLLKSEIDNLKQSADPASKADLVKKENKLKALSEFADAHEQFQTRPVKVKTAEAIFEAIKKEQNLEELTDEEKIEILNQTQDMFKETYGAELSDEEISHIIDSSKGEQQLNSKFETAYKNYLKNTNGIDPSYVFDTDIDESFVKVKDYYKLFAESKRLVESINLLHDPQSFMNHVSKTQAWMTNMYNNRKDYFVDMVNKQMAALESNELLNKLADMNIFIDLDQFQEFMENGTPPKEFLDETNKQVIPIGSKKYKQLFFMLSQAKALKGENVSTETLDEKLQDTIEGLENSEKKELDGLEKTKVKTIIKTVKKDGLTIKDIALVINMKEYVDITDAKTGNVFTLYSSEDGLRNDNADGDLISIKDITSKFSEYTIYKLEEKADPEQVKVIEEKYNKLKEENINEFNAKKETGKAELYSIHTPVDQLPKDLYKELQNAFNNSEEAMSVETDEFDDEIINDMFASYILRNPAAKKIIDDYNTKAQEAIEKQKADEGDEFNFKRKGEDVSTTKYKTDELIAMSDQLKQLRNVETDPVTKEKYSTMISKFEKLITSRKRKSFAPDIQETIKVLKEKLIAQQKNIAKNKEDNYITNGKTLERVTHFIQKFKEDKYTYKGNKLIAEAFAKTIDTEGLTTNSINKFMAEIDTTLPALSNSGYTKDTVDGVKSTSTLVKKYLKDLLKEEATTPIKSKKDLLVDIQSFISENAYEYTRTAGTYLDKQLRSFFTPGQTPKFDEARISREAYDELFGPDSFIKPLKAKIDSGELFVLADNIKVFDEESGIAGEIDLLLIDQTGKLQIVDFKTGEQKKWNGFQKDTRTESGLNKIEDYTLQQYTYARLLKKMTGLDAEINIMPLEITINQTEHKIASVKQPSNQKLLGIDKWYFPLNPEFRDAKSKIDAVIKISDTPGIKVATAMNPKLIAEFERLGYPEDVIKTLSKEDQKNIITDDIPYAKYQEQLDNDLNSLAFADEIAAAKGKQVKKVKEVSLADKEALRDQVRALPDDMIYGLHVTGDDVAKNIYEGQFKYNLGTALQGTVGVGSKESLYNALLKLQKGESPHRGQLGMFILAFPKSEFGESTIEKRVSLDTIEDQMLETYPEMAVGKIPTKFNYGYFSHGKLYTKNDALSKKSPAVNSISNGDNIIDTVKTKPVTNQIKDAKEFFITSDKDPLGRIYINMAPLKDILVVPDNTLTVIDKKTNKEIVNTQLNPEGAVIFEAMQGRLFVVAKINGQLVPFYKSSAGTSGKNQGDWYPFFGYTGAWLVKGSVDKATGKMPYSPEIDKVTELLNKNFVFPDMYINRATNLIKDQSGNVAFDFNNHFKINRLWKKEFQSQTGTKLNYKIKGLKENTRTESGLMALITSLNTTELDSSGKDKEFNEWIDLINKNIKAGAVQPTNTTVNKKNVVEKQVGPRITIEEVKNKLESINEGPVLEEYLVNLREGLINNQITIEDRPAIVDLVNAKKEEFKLANTKLSKTILHKGDTVIVKEPIPGEKDKLFADRGSKITVIKSTETGVEFQYGKDKKTLSLSKLDKHVTTLSIQQAKDAQLGEQKIDEMDKEVIAESIKKAQDFIDKKGAIGKAETEASEKSLDTIYEDLLNDLDC